MPVPKVECIGVADNYGRFKIAPLETGYGLTLGNALRRVLISSLEGTAVTAVQVDGVQHEFSSLPGVKEDMTDIVLNLKRLRLRSYAAEPVTLRLDASGPGVVTVADVRPHADVEIVLDGVPLATLDSQDATLHLELTVNRGRGYVPAEAQEELPIGVIPVDALYSPVTRVNYLVDRTRVGQKTDYDQLTLEIWTDGTVAPGDALSQAAQLLVDQVQVVAAYAQGESEVGEATSLALLISPEADARSIDELQLGQRTQNALKRAGMLTVGQVLAKSKRDLLTIRNFGDKSLSELQEKLQEMGYLPSSLPEGYLEHAEDAAPIGVLGNQGDIGASAAAPDEAPSAENEDEEPGPVDAGLGDEMHEEGSVGGET